MGFLSRFRMLFAPHQARAALPIAFNADSFRIGSDDCNELAWDKVLKIVTYKIDLFAVDEIQVEFIHADGGLVVTEESPGFPAFMDEMVRRFPTASDWHEKVSQPPFAASKTVLYEKVISALHT
jgi:hypothetical protein